MATVRSTAEVLADEKKLIAEIEKKHGETVDELRAEREKRMQDAIELRVPDRVPINLPVSRFATGYVGITASTQYYDQATYMEACRKALLDFEPDTIGTLGTGNSGLVYELLDSKQHAWPGGNLPPDTPYQFIEGEYMKADEYDWFLSDPSDFVLRAYLPRIFGTMSPTAKLPPFRTMVGGTSLTGVLGLFTRPEFCELADKIYRAAQEQQKVTREAAGFTAHLERLGFPREGRGGRGAGGAPFDVISDYLRGMRGAMLDMYRCPDKLLAATNNILEWAIARAEPADPGRTGGLRMGGGGALHRGSDGFMSLKQFEKFYWPGLKKATLVSIGLGYTVSHFFEGVWDQRLEYLLELPRGVIFRCEKTDIFKAKKVLGGHMCIQGGVPPTLLEVGSPQEVEEHCKKVIKVVGKDGGLILSVGTGSKGARPENVRAMVESVNKYGWY